METFATLVEAPGAITLLEEAGGLALARQAGGESELLTIAVVPEARHRGLGRRLLTAVLTLCPHPVFLEVDADNAAALALYGRAGFAECGRRPAYYGPERDALILRRGEPIAVV